MKKKTNSKSPGDAGRPPGLPAPPSNDTDRFLPEEDYGDDAGAQSGAEPVDAAGSEEGKASEPEQPMARIEDVAPEDPDAGEQPEALPSEIEDETAFVEDMPRVAEFQEPAEIRAALECLFFTTPHPLSLGRLRAILGPVDPRTLRGAVAQLQAEYDARANGLQIVENADGFQMCTRLEYANVVLRLHRQRKRNPLTVTALETLTIVAYKQPITRAEIEMIRGVESSGVLRNLLDMGMLRVVGRKEVIGRPQLYGTTSVFLNAFGLKSLKDLPPINELRQRYAGSSLFTPGGGEQGIAPPAEDAGVVAEAGPASVGEFSDSSEPAEPAPASPTPDTPAESC